MLPDRLPKSLEGDIWTVLLSGVSRSRLEGFEGMVELEVGQDVATKSRPIKSHPMKMAIRTVEATADLQPITKR